MKASQKLQSRDRGILERKYIHQVLTESGAELTDAHKAAIGKLLNQHTTALITAPRAQVQDSGIAGGSLTVHHLKRQRFLDMKTRKLKNGSRVRKKAYTIHNKILYGHLNTIIRKLSYGFTEAVQQKIQRELTIPING